MSSEKSELPVALLDAYRSTAYVVSGTPTPMVLNIGVHNQAAATLLQAHGVESALFITAHNPWGQHLLPRDNHMRHARMVADLRAWPLLSGFGVSPKGDWPPETGVLVLCGDLVLQEQWLQQYSQNAAVRVTQAGEVSLVLNPSRPTAVLQVGASGVVTEPLLFSEFPAHERLCYYPSCGRKLLWAVMQLDADLFVFSDNNRRFSNWAAIESDFLRRNKPIELVVYGKDFVQFRSGTKTGVLLWEDNNLTLNRLHQAQHKAHHFVGICDGCCEGGNHECVHERPFVRRLMRVAADAMLYFTDHSRPLQRESPSLGGGWNARPKYVEHARLDHFPEPPDWHNPRCAELTDAEPSRVMFELQNLLIRRNNTGLEILPKAATIPSQLNALRPFRHLAKREILAEYLVTREPVTSAALF